jgi:hydroxyacid-oxoacid transhydrogenase
MVIVYFVGQNPVSDIWSLHALRIVAKYLKRSIDDAHDTEARTAMHMAGSFVLLHSFLCNGFRVY